MLHKCLHTLLTRTYCFGYRLQLVRAGFKATVLFFFSSFAKLGVEYVTLSCLQLHPRLPSAIHEIIIVLSADMLLGNDIIREGMLYVS